MGYKGDSSNYRTYFSQKKIVLQLVSRNGVSTFQFRFHKEFCYNSSMYLQKKKSFWKLKLKFLKNSEDALGPEEYTYKPKQENL